MAKKTRKKKQKVRKSHIFFLGVLIGMGLVWLPFDLDFSQTELSENPFGSQSVFQKYLPTTSPYIEHEGFVVSYDGKTKNPHWVYHKLTEKVLSKTTSRAECDFKEDPALPPLIRATKKDYLGSGFDRGHLCAAGDCVTQEEMEDSFFLTNVVPQDPGLNRGLWRKLEEHVRSLTKQYPTVHVFTGPLYLSHKAKGGKRFVRYQVIGKNEVAVPTHFFLLLFVTLPSNKLLNKAFIIPNKSLDPKTSFKRYSASMEEVERASGVMFTNVLEANGPKKPT